MIIVTCRCGTPVKAKRRSRKWCAACFQDKRRAWHRARQRRYHAQHRAQENERARRWRKQQQDKNS
jgi:hypothetical protein